MKTKKPKKKVVKNIIISTPGWHYTHDFVTNVEYIKVRSGRPSGSRVIRNGLILDINAMGEVVGIEILTPSPNKHTL